MKVDLSELKKAVQWVEANTNQNEVAVYLQDSRLTIKTMDRRDSEVEITIYDGGSLKAKIKKTEVL